MATVSGPVVDLNSLWNIWTPFFLQLNEDRKLFREWQVAYGALEDVINSTPTDSNTYKEYYKLQNDLDKYGADILRGSHPAGVMADRAVSIFRRYGKITGKVNNLLEKLKTSLTNRFNAISLHPGGVIWQLNSVTDNIDDIANGKSVNDKFIDRKGALDIVQNLFANIGASLARDPIYNKILETLGFSVEVLQRGGIDALLIDDIWLTGTSNRASADIVGMLNHYMQLVKLALGYDLFDDIGKDQLKSLIKTGAVGALAATKANVIDSGETARQELQFKYANLHESLREFDANYSMLKENLNIRKDNIRYQRSLARKKEQRRLREERSNKKTKKKKNSSSSESTPATSTYTASSSTTTSNTQSSSLTLQLSRPAQSKPVPPPKRGSVSTKRKESSNSERLS